MNKKLLILSAICAVLLIAGLVTKRQPHQSMTEQARLVDLFPGGLDVKQIQRVEVETVPAEESADAGAPQDQAAAPKEAGRDSLLVLEKEKNHWRLASRFGVGAKSKEVETLLNKISGLKGEFRSDAADLLADYGLDRASAMTIRIFTSDGEKPNQVLLAGKEAGSGRQFVRLDGSNKVYTVDVDLRQKLGASSTDLHQGPDYKTLANLDLLEVGPSKTNRIRVKTPYTEYLLEKQAPTGKDPADAGRDKDQAGDTAQDRKKTDDKQAPVWKLVSGNLMFGLKPDGPRKLVEAAFGLTAGDVPGAMETGKSDTHGLDEPQMELLLGSPEGETTLLVGRTDQDQGPGGSYYVKLENAPQVYLVGRHRIDNLLVRQDQVFDLGLWNLSAGDLTEITIDGDLILTRRDGRWILPDLGADQAVNDSRVDQLAADLADLSAYSPGDRLSVNPRGRRLVLVEKNGNRHELVVGETSPAGNFCPAYQEGKPSPFLLEKYKVDRLFPQRAELVTQKTAGSSDQTPPGPGGVPTDPVQPGLMPVSPGNTNP